MALTTANVDTSSHTFQTWVDKTNILLDAYSTTIVTTAANSSGGITTGNATVNGIFTSNSVSVNGNSTFGLRGGNVTTNATLFITSNVSIGNASVNTVINTTTIDTDLMLTVLGNTSLTNGTVTFTTNSTSNVYTFGAGNTSFDSGVLFVDAVNNKVGVNNTAPGVALEVTGSANISTSVNSSILTVGTSFIANTTGAYHTGTINAASFTTTGLLANVTALVPTSNTILLGNSIGRFILSANTGDFTGAVNGASFSTSGLVANTTALVATSNTILLGNSIGRFVLSANTGNFTGTLTGTVANMSTSVNSALLTVGTSFIANTTGVFHTGTINAASFTTTGVSANTTAIVPTSNTILLGDAVGRFVLSANTGNFTGAVTGTVANMSTSVNSAVLTVGTNFIANTTQVTIGSGVLLSSNGTTGTAGHVLISNGAIGSPYWATFTPTIPASYVQNTDSRTLSGNLVISGTSFTPSSNTVLLGNATQRWVLSANTGDFTGTVTGTVANMSTSVNSALLTVGTSFIANTTGVFHTGTINAASFTTSGLRANTTAIVPTSNTILLGNSIGRFILSANTGDFTGAVSGISFSTSGLVANTTAIAPTSNTILLGNSIGRFVLSANTGDFSGNVTISGTSHSIAGNVDIDSGTLIIDAGSDTVKVKNLSTNTGSIYISTGTLPGVTLMSISNGDIGSNITSAQTIATFTKTLYPTGQLTITASNTTHKQVEHLIFAHNGTDVQTTVFGRVAAPASANLGIANVAISGADLLINFNQVTASTKINILANLFTP